MTQQNVLKILRKKKSWLTSKEISKTIKLGHNTVAANLAKLFKHGEVHRRIRNKREFEYRAKLKQ